MGLAFEWISGVTAGIEFLDGEFATDLTDEIFNGGVCVLSLCIGRVYVFW